MPGMTYEYARVPWEQVADLAAQGWRLMQIPPMPEMKAVLGQVQMTGVVLFFMEREDSGDRERRLRDHASIGQKVLSPDALIVPPGR